MKIYPIILLVLLTSHCKNLFSQSDTTDLRKNLQEEILLEDLKSEDEDSKMLDFLEDLKRNPYDLNRVSLDKLESIPFLNSVLAKKIIEYRNEIKFFNSKRGLLKIDGVSEELYEKIKIYLVVRQTTRDILIDETGKKYKVKELATASSFRPRLRSSFTQDMQMKKGYLNGKYEGAKQKIYNQLNIKYGNLRYNLEANFTMEKDAGEKNLTDFASGFIELKNYKFIKDAVAGDYTLSFAQGLAMWSGSSFSKGANSVSPLKKRGKGIDGYSSVSEVQFLRGGAAKFNITNFYLNFFYSDNYYDASLDTTVDGISSFYYDGLHRTSAEINRTNSAKERLFGGRVSFEKGSLRIGSTYWTSKFSKSIIADSLKKLFNFSGISANMIGADYDLVQSNMNFYGEFARSQSGSVASINSLQLTFSKFADILFSYRNYPKDFAPLHSSGFGERSGETNNERGFYAGITLRPVKGLLINSYFDQFEFPYRTFFNPVPVNGNDFLVNIEWRAAKGFVFNIKYKNENKEDTRTITDKSGRDMKRIDGRNQLNTRAGFVYQVTDRFRLRSRFEYVNVEYKNFGGNSKGILFFSDARITLLPGLVIDTRFVFFDTDNYDSRIYQFESDIKGVMSNVAVYGKGRRWYVVLKYKPFPFADLSLKYAETFINGARSIGSGNDEIKGDVNNRLSAGLEIGF
ncbi:MAG: helix-hairpin-helix domain-containing protein [Ignavibacteria bacterium]